MTGNPYTDLERPPLNAAQLNKVKTGMWTRIDLRAETGSTNADAAAAAQEGEAEGLVVVAERQTAGRGRIGRTWTSPPRAGLAVSVLLRPTVPAARYGWLPLLAGVALTESVSRVTGVDAVLKWPNDLLINGRKCAGILAEAVSHAVVVGIGLNVTTREDELPENATSLALAGAAATDRDPLLRALLRALEDWYSRWQAASGDAVGSGLAAAYARHCDTIGRQVKVLMPDGGELLGAAEAIDHDGRLVVRPESGGVRHVAAGDILHLR